MSIDISEILATPGVSDNFLPISVVANDNCSTIV